MSNIVKSNPMLLNERLSMPSVQSQFEQALGESKGTFISSLLSLYSSDTKLSKCDPNDVIVEALKAASLRLPLDKNLGLAYVIPYNKKVGNEWVSKPEFQLGYKGLVQLALRSGVYKHFNDGVVYEGELKSYDKLSGSIDLSGDKTSNKPIGYFAYLSTVNGFEKTEYMTVEEVAEHAKKFSKTYEYKSSPWQTDFDAMAKKTVILKLLRVYGQLSIEVQSILGSEDDPFKKEFSSDRELSVIDIPTDDDVAEEVDTETGEIKSNNNKNPY